MDTSGGWRYFCWFRHLCSRGYNVLIFNLQHTLVSGYFVHIFFFRLNMDSWFPTILPEVKDTSKSLKFLFSKYRTMGNTGKCIILNVICNYDKYYSLSERSILLGYFQIFVSPPTFSYPHNEISNIVPSYDVECQAVFLRHTTSAMNVPSGITALRILERGNLRIFLCSFLVLHHRPLYSCWFF